MLVVASTEWTVDTEWVARVVGIDSKAKAAAATAVCERVLGNFAVKCECCAGRVVDPEQLGPMMRNRWDRLVWLVLFTTARPRDACGERGRCESP